MRIAVRHRVVDVWQHIDVVLYRIVILCHTRESRYPDLTHNLELRSGFQHKMGMTISFESIHPALIKPHFDE